MIQPDSPLAETPVFERHFQVLKTISSRDPEEAASLVEVAAHLDNSLVLKLLRERLSEMVLAVEDLSLLLETLEKREQFRK